MTRYSLKSALTGVLVMALAAAANAGVVFGNTGLTGGYRWDAAPRTIADVGERSLDGGLRYSMQGGSFEAFRNLFSWTALPDVASFQTAVQSAFDVWTKVDPVSGLGTNLYFVADLATSVVGANTGSGGLDIRGAEIDLFGSTDAYFWNVGNTGTQGESSFTTIASTVTLTSGTTNYAGSRAIAGADIILNSNSGAVYSLNVFTRLLAHEIGHALGFGDIEGDINPGSFIDDNFDSGDPLGTMTNSWAHLVDVYDPADSPLALYNIGGASTTAGVDILMESRNLGISAANPLGNLSPMRNDDYGTRQFLYPYIQSHPVPAPSVLALVMIGLCALCVSSRRGGGAG